METKKRNTGRGHAPAKAIKAPTFDRTVPWKNYQTWFETAALNNGWNKKDRATTLVLALRGPALEVLQSIPSETNLSGNKNSQKEKGIGMLELRINESLEKRLQAAQKIQYLEDGLGKRKNSASGWTMSAETREPRRNRIRKTSNLDTMLKAKTPVSRVMTLFGYIIIIIIQNSTGGTPCQTKI
ncbi:hypothetical protein HELRODRAFT_174317 [Helobdella robusta]|uniref:Uncharacterized protein n=1 Tax=Helobdella robusta TaxID=6412 RepID=T1F7Z6_HELRO|nr:hypothetical protein HELRODRAFT_174317 [Helobdella robusta]ESO02875.1 hypothetical protein HELRODRAFT_174317 [Helobdella robusta]